MPTKVLQNIEGCKAFPSDQSQIPDGKYMITSDEERTVEAADDNIRAEIWFKTPALDIATIRKIDRLQLLADSHDQGYADVTSGGNWTWFELAILEDESAYKPRVKDGVELVWKSHYNRFLEEEFGWDGNVIAVRLCARFTGWSIAARKGYLTMEIDTDDIERDPPPAYGEIVSKIENIQAVFREVNSSIQAGFMPTLPDALHTAQLLSTGAERPLRVLSLDGGGVRGLSSLHLLNAVMKKAAPDKKPCEVFDMIGGTSTGGYIAIMLGRLKMSVDECIGKYQDFMVKIFNKGTLKKGLDFIANGEFYDETVLEGLIKQLVKEKTGGEDTELLEAAGNPTCKVFCMAVNQQAGNNRAPIFLRSYQNKQEMSLIPDIKIWQAARATSAAPAYFAPITVGDYTLVDGGMGANNPLGWLWTEVLAVFGPARPTSCFLSIGTGMAANQSITAPGAVPSHTVEAAFAAVATNTELTNILFRALVNAFAPRPMEKKYWRLNVSQEIPAWDEEKRTWFGLGGTSIVHHQQDYKDVGALDDVGALKALIEMTGKYIGDQDAIIGECAKALMAAVA
ncbi:hypothetical protein JDV02_008616 [Purpureocillium takamizusanense]|uniref:PNPLA domain-containing protein n=1 Tax=Purpureocillium takamizusanense TaxID=2060973 RepID=A0A9Q8QNB2_9HYPO|nr:uncharacterized protein JDV02_008616 [Purpureocillium takamizusanense]UNI22755.1 hypothetical protein JDV02_008616 [Purpureocillium takamizusanense]